MPRMKRGSNVSLTREIPGLTGVVLGVQYSAGAEKVITDNLVVGTILCNSYSKALSDRHFIFFNQLRSPDLSVTQVVAALGEDHVQVEVDLYGVPADVARLVIVMYLNEGVAQRRALGQLRECAIRVLNLDGNVELVRSENLAIGLTNEIGMALGEVYRYNGEWKFKVIGEGYANGIAGIAADYGVTL
jgi:tellurium resistance protein TerD